MVAEEHGVVIAERRYPKGSWQVMDQKIGESAAS